jgi:hypothetical protein
MWLADQLAARQALLNLRDSLKADGRMVILLAPELSLPIELQHSVESLDEPLPDREAIGVIVSGLLSGASLPSTSSTVTDAAEALIGLSAFASEQAAALALSKDGISITDCWDRKRRQVEQTPGLSMSESAVSFTDVGGLSSAKEYFSKFFSGPCAPRVILRMEEIEKLMAGSSTGAGDNTGVSQDFLQVLLDRIESSKWLGALFLGPGGSGKSYFSEALAGEFGVRSVSLDTGAMKSSALGASEAAIRGAMKTIEAIGGSRVLICATCNGLDELKPELQRRLASAGMWLFDLPDADEKAAIWALQSGKFGVSGPFPSDAGWSSSDIRDCCRTAYMLNESLTQAAVRVSPAMSRESKRIEALRRLASNAALSSASYPGPYKYSAMATNQAPAGGRAVSLEAL